MSRPLNLWRPGESFRRASDLVRAFAQFPHLPKMLRQKDIAETLALGCEEGHFVLRLSRPDKTIRTFWRSRPGDVELKERDLEVVLPEEAELTELEGSLLAPGAIPCLWPPDGSPVSFGAMVESFDGKHVSKVQREGYEEAFPIPKAPKGLLERAVQDSVKAGLVWLIAGPASIFKEDIPLGVLSDAATLNPPPSPIAATSLLPQNLPQAWAQDVTTAAAISAALSVLYEKPLPWPLIAGAIDGAIRARLLERAEDSGPWPCDWSGAGSVRLRLPAERPAPVPMPARPALPDKPFAEAELEPSELQDLVDGLGEILKAGAGLDLRFVLRVEIGTQAEVKEEQISKLNQALKKSCGKLQVRTPY